MILAFTLHMPHAPTWNNRWSGDERLHVLTRSFRGRTKEEQARAIAAAKSFWHRWEDGWSARVDVKIVSADEARQMRQKSCGHFCGYDWMVDSICRHGDIRYLSKA